MSFYKTSTQTTKKILGEKLIKLVRPLLHGSKSYLASWYFGRPGRKLKIVGITGTKGKTSTTVLTGRIFNLLGLKTGYISTACIYIGDRPEQLNPYKMTSIDGVTMHMLLKKMVANGCQYLILELSSQGLEQRRHFGLGKLEVATFLNLYPEHLEAHGSLENYKNAKSILFRNLKKGGVFISNGNPDQLANTAFMLACIPSQVVKTVKKLLIIKKDKTCLNQTPQKIIQKTINNSDYLDFQPQLEYQILNLPKKINKNLILDNCEYQTNFQADFLVTDFVFALKIASCFDSNKQQLSSKQINLILQKLSPNLPGRMDWAVRDGIANKEPTDQYKSTKNPTKQTQNFEKLRPASRNISILVDYAHEPESMYRLLQNLKTWQREKIFDKIIHVVSCDGVGRDDWKKPKLGKISTELADISILTTDNYEKGDNPQQIVDLLAFSLSKTLENQKFFKITDRLLAFRKALNLGLELAQKNSQKILIVSTGVGSEDGLTRPEGKLDWQEKEIWQQEFKLVS